MSEPSIWYGVGIVGTVIFWLVLSKVGSSVPIKEEGESPDTNDMEQLPNGDWRYKV